MRVLDKALFRQAPQRFFAPYPKERSLTLDELPPDVDYAVSKWFPESGGFRTVIITGATLQASWRRALASGQLSKFKASFWVRPTNRCRVELKVPAGWIEVLLSKRLYLLAQPVRGRHYVA